MKDSKTLKLFSPYMSQFRATYQKARRYLKKRIDTKTSTVNSNLQDQQVHDPVDDTEAPADESLEENELAIDQPEIDQNWEISNGNDFLNALITEKDPYIVQFFDPTARNDVYKLNDLKFEVLPEDSV